MSESLSSFEKELLDALQKGIEICPRPYEALARRLAVSQSQVLEGIARLKGGGLIRRFRGQIHYRVLGRVATLAAAEVPSEKLDRVIAAVNALPGVSHNYLRDHAYNLWFTLQAKSYEQIDAILSGLTNQHGVAFYSLPAERVFKLDVRFELGSGGGEARNPAGPAGFERPVVLSDAEKRVLRFLQAEFPQVADPFARVEGLDERACVEAAESLCAKGAVKRIAAVVNHYKLGITANVMFCAAVADDQIESAGASLAGYRQVSHCYRRRSFAGWPYTLYAMIHAHREDLIRTWIEDFVHTAGIGDYALLRTVRELKKEPVLLDFVE